MALESLDQERTGRFIQSLRKELGLTQRQLAEKLDLLQFTDFFLRIIAISVFHISFGGQESLLLIETDIPLGDACLLLHFVDLHKSEILSFLSS